MGASVFMCDRVSARSGSVEAIAAALRLFQELLFSRKSGAVHIMEDML